MYLYIINIKNLLVVVRVVNVVVDAFVYLVVLVDSVDVLTKILNNNN